jgi:nitrate/nitrite transporter NarK
VLRGPLAPFLCEEFHLTDTQQGLLVAVPLLGGSLFRPLLGVLGDRIGGRRAGLIGLALQFRAMHVSRGQVRQRARPEVLVFDAQATSRTGADWSSSICLSCTLCRGPPTSPTPEHRRSARRVSTMGTLTTGDSARVFQRAIR